MRACFQPWPGGTGFNIGKGNGGEHGPAYRGEGLVYEQQFEKKRNSQCSPKGTIDLTPTPANKMFSKKRESLPNSKKGESRPLKKKKEKRKRLPI